MWVIYIDKGFDPVSSKLRKRFYAGITNNLLGQAPLDRAVKFETRKAANQEFRFLRKRWFTRSSSKVMSYDDALIEVMAEELE